MGYDEGQAKSRIDLLARWLAGIWTAFLMYIVIAQANGDGTTLTLWGCKIAILPKFALKEGEFIAVITSTTAAVFGFMTIVAHHLFGKSRD